MDCCRKRMSVDSVCRQCSAVILLCICTLLAAVLDTAKGATPVWITPPRDSKTLLGESVTLQCRVQNLENRDVAWINGVGENLFINDQKWTPLERFQIAGFSNGYDMTITTSEKVDNGYYMCQVQQTDLKKRVNITVLVSPEEPTLTVNNTSPQEGDIVELTCSSSQGNPSPNIVWYRNNVPLGDSGVISRPSQDFGLTSSVLIRQLTRDDHNAIYKCEAENEANFRQPVSASTQLEVLYAPVINFGPYSPLKVVEGSLSVLHCNVDANPAPESRNIHWEKMGSIIGTGSSYELPSISKEQAGDYICRASNLVGQSEATLPLDVQYAPKVSVHVLSIPMQDHIIRVNEYAKVNITCNVDANPPIRDRIEWIINNGAIISRGPSFVTESVTRTQTANYTCRVKNVVAPSGGIPREEIGSEMVRLIVQYRPGRASITGPSYAIKNSPASLVCSVDDPGEPPAKLYWSRAASIDVLHTGAELMFQPAQLDNNTNYVCKPSNDVGDGNPADINLVVNETPEWLGDKGRLPGSVTVTMSTTDLSVRCQVRGKPQPQLEWYKDGHLLKEFDGYFQIHRTQQSIDLYSTNVTSTLYFRGPRRYPQSGSIRIQDRGDYSCRARNDISNGELHSEMKLTVHYPPVLNATTDKVATDINQSAVLVCQGHGVPQPVLEWYSNSVLLQDGGRISIRNEHSTGIYPYRSILNITDIEPEDLGDYVCRGSNTIGNTDLVIHLTVKTIPDPPKKIWKVSRTWESVELTWERGFDGGYPQWFILDFVSTGLHRDRRPVQPPQANKFNITRLFPGTNYTFKVFGTNELGPGSYSSAITVATAAFIIEPPTEVYYDSVTKALTFKSPSTNYCVRIESFDGKRWTEYEPCAPVTGGSIQLSEEEYILDVRVAFCLERRQEVCSKNQSALIVDAPPKDVPLETIIIVACVCGSVVVILSIILIVLCCRRYQAKNKDYDSNANGHAQTIMSNGGQPRKPMDGHVKGTDNPGMAPVDAIDLDDPTNGGVFSTDISHLTPQYTGQTNYVMFDRRKQLQANGHAQNGYPPNLEDEQPWNRRNGNRPHEAPPRYDTMHQNDPHRNHQDYTGSPDSDYLAVHKGRRKDDHLHGDTPDKTLPDHLKEGSDSGVSTPDPVKPRKVIYEVIV